MSDHTNPELEARLDEAWAALDAGSADEALAAVRALTSEPGAAAYGGELCLLEVQAHLRAGERAAARAAIDAAAGLGARADDPNLLLARAELALAEWSIDEARELYARLAEAAHPDEAAAHHERLALCHDLAGRHELADEHLLRSRGVPPDHLSPEAFEAVVVSAAEDLPAPFRALFERYAVIVDPVPDHALATGGGRDPLETPPDLFGLFLGASELDGSYSGEHPPHIRLFQRNLERAAESMEHLHEEIRITLYHELGHALGLDEEGVDAIGLG